MASVLGISYLLPLSRLDMVSTESRRKLSGIGIRVKAAARPLRVKPSPYLSTPLRFSSFSSLAAHREASKVADVEEAVLQEGSEKVPTFDEGSSDEIKSSSAEDKSPPSAVISSLEFYKEALANGDQPKIAELEVFFQSIEHQRNSLQIKITALSDELGAEKDRILRISADFDNFRKRTDRVRQSLMENVQGDVVESLLPVLDNFERARTQIKPETDGEEKVNGSYQSIYKQFVEIITSLGVITVETVGTAFDPMLHEAILREDSTEFEEGIIVQEFRKGFKLGEKLLRPAMVKVSAGPGPAKPKAEEKEVAAESDNSTHE